MVAKHASFSGQTIRERTVSFSFSLNKHEATLLGSNLALAKCKRDFPKPDLPFPIQKMSKNFPKWCSISFPRTSDGGNGDHSESLPIILIKIKVDQMLPSSYISSLLVSIL